MLKTQHIQSVLDIILGGIITLVTFNFLYSYNVIMLGKTNKCLEYIIIMLILGSGFYLGARWFVRHKVNKELMVITTIFTSLLLTLKIVYFIISATNRCRCLSFSDAVYQINDWSHLSLSLFLFFWLIIVWYVRKKLHIINENI